MEFDIWVFFFENPSTKIQVPLKSDKKKCTLHEDQCTFLIISRSFLLRMRNVSDKSCRENQNIHFMFNYIFFSKIVPLWDKVEKYCTVGQATDDNMAHAHCMLYTQGHTHTHTLRICDTCCLSTATMVERKRLDITLYLCFLSC